MMGHIFLRPKNALQIQTHNQHLLLFPDQAFLNHFEKNKKEEIYVIGDSDDNKYISSTKNLHIYDIDKLGESFDLGRFEIQIGGGVRVKVGNAYIFYDREEALGDKNFEECSIAFVNADFGEERLYAVMSQLNPKIGIPFGDNIDTSKYIDICRECMQRQLCVPKYLQANQYLVFES